MTPMQDVALSVHVAGTPKPQGSKRGFVVTGQSGKPRAVVVDSAKGPLRDWRSDVIAALSREHDAPPITGPVGVRLVFALPKPAKPRGWAPSGRVGDLDKLARAVLDALTIAGVIEDDAQVCDLMCSKRYPGPAVAQTVPGVLITVARITDTPGDRP